MKSAKAEGKRSPLNPKPEQTPFERFTEFTRRILAVPHSEIAAEERKYQRTKKKRKRCQ